MVGGDLRIAASALLFASALGVAGAGGEAFADRGVASLPERPGEARWPTDPLPAELLARLRGVPEDPGLQAPRTHFVVSDERRHDVFRPFLEGLGGVLVGVGTDQNYLMAGWMRPELVLVVDYDPVVVALHEVYRVIFEHAEGPERFRQLWEEPEAERVRAWIEADAPDEASRRARLRAYRISARLVRIKLRGTVRRLREAGVPSFLTDPDQYRGVRNLVRQGRVVALRADLTGPRRLRALWEVLREARMPVRALYLSNVERYFGYDAGRFRDNLREAPGDERSLVLRTVGWGHRWPSPEGDGRYLYVVQRLDNLRRWLAHPRVKTYKPMVRRRRPTPIQGLYLSEAEPPPLPRRLARHRGR